MERTYFFSYKPDRSIRLLLYFQWTGVNKTWHFPNIGYRWLFVQLGAVLTKDVWKAKIGNRWRNRSAKRMRFFWLEPLFVMVSIRDQWRISNTRIWILSLDCIQPAPLMKKETFWKTKKNIFSHNIIIKFSYTAYFLGNPWTSNPSVLKGKWLMTFSYSDWLSTWMGRNGSLSKISRKIDTQRCIKISV